MSQRNAPTVTPAFDVVAIAASTGGQEACRTILSELPADFPAPIVLSRHGHPGARADWLPGILNRDCALHVVSAASGSELRPGAVSVTPPGAQVTIQSSGRLGVTQRGPGPNHDGDALFDSAARHHGRRALGVVLTGRLDDGADGVRAVKRGGGRVLVQDPRSARAGGMPTAAIATGCVDLVLPLDLVASGLVAMVMAPGAAEMLRVPLPPWADMASPVSG